MSDGLRRLLSRSRSKSRTRSRPQISEPLEKGALEDPPLLFRASAYGDVSTGASPVHGLLPLRGNRSYAIRRSSTEYPSSRPSSTPRDSNSSTSRVNRLSKSRSTHTSRNSSRERVSQAEPVELPASTRRPQSEVITKRWSLSRPRSQRSSRHGSPERDPPPVPPLPKTSSEAGSIHYRPPVPSDRPKRASRQSSWERAGPNSLAAHPPFAENVASRYNPHRSSQSSVEEKRINAPANGHVNRHEPSQAGYPHGSPAVPYTDRGEPKPLEPAWYITRTPRQRSPSEYEKAQRAAGTAQQTPPKSNNTPPATQPLDTQLPASEANVTEPPAELEAEAPPPRPERKRPRTRRSHIKRKNSEGGVNGQETPKGDSSSQERKRSVGTETRAAVAAAVAAAAAAPAEPNASKARHSKPRATELEAKSVGSPPKYPPESPRDDVSAISWATAEDGEHPPRGPTGPARPADMLFPAGSESRQDTPRVPESQRVKALGEEFAPERQIAKERDPEISPPSARSVDGMNDYFHMPGAFPTAEEVVRRAQFNSVNTTIYETVAPPVTHELIIPRIHHIREERITREIHNHDVYHRVLPIKETVMLPPKHYRLGSRGELIELRPEEVPVDSNDGWVFLDTVSVEEIPLETQSVTAQELAAFRRHEPGAELPAIPAG